MYRRTVRVGAGESARLGWIAVHNLPDQNALAVTVSPSLVPVLPRVIARVKTLFDTEAAPQAMEAALSALGDMYLPGVRVPGCMDAFEMATRAVLGQQITVKAARTLATRIAALGDAVETPFPGLNRAFPSPQALLALPGTIEDNLGPLGVIGARARSIAALAGALGTGALTLAPGCDPEKEIRTLQTLPGFGPWTAQYVAMRALAWPDAFPHTDYGVKKALEGKAPREILEMSEAWKPWRAYATMCLWNALS